MPVKFPKIISIVIIIILFCKCNAFAESVSTEKYILPKSFKAQQIKIDDKLLPPLQNKQPVKEPLKQTVKTPPKTTSTGKTTPAPQKAATSITKTKANPTKPPVKITSTLKTVPVPQKAVVPVIKTTTNSIKPPSKTISTLKTPPIPQKNQQVLLPNQVSAKKSTVSVSKTTVNKPQKAIAATPNKAPNAALKTLPQKTVLTHTPAIYTNVSLASLVKNYKYSYEDTLKSTMFSLIESNITPVSYNTDRGQIIAKLPSGKELFILIVPFNDTYTCVRITPTDGNYNLPLTSINQIFTTIDTNLKSN